MTSGLDASHEATNAATVKRILGDFIRFSSMVLLMANTANN
jgi:hypothetical protein